MKARSLNPVDRLAEARVVAAECRNVDREAVAVLPVVEVAAVRRNKADNCRVFNSASNNRYDISNAAPSPQFAALVR